ncbi:MAG: ATP-binding protein [Gracilibacteraceae bacterium]|jgi:Na+-driven multidrug efflux pump/anti-sigma regulatory factor (Ser/Thr protein kinase)|nr:ATP-binding protein [Gracilibacteraceae bacterium]
MSVSNAVKSGGLTSNDAFINDVAARYLVPSVLAMLGSRLSTLANGLVLGRVLGAPGLSCLSLVGPVSLFYLSLGALIGMGASIVSGFALGRGDRERCDRIYTLSYILSGAAGLPLLVGGVTAADAIAEALGAGDDIFLLTRDFIRVAAVGGVFTVLMYTPLNYLRLCGKPNHAMGMLLIMSFANMGFSAFFVLIVGMRTTGVALGGALGALAALAFGLYHLSGDRSGLHFRAGKFPAADLRTVLAFGSAPALNNICRAGQYFLINLLLLRVAPAALPAYYVVCAVQEAPLALILGFAQILSPLLSVAFGERDGRSIRKIVKKIFLPGTLLLGAGALGLFLLRRRVGFWFGLPDDPAAAEVSTGLVFLALSLNISFFNNMAANYFNATKRPAVANIVAVCRLLVFMVGPAYLLAGKLSVTAVWLSLLVAELSTAAVLALTLTVLRARDGALSPFWLLDPSFTAGENTIDFSVLNTNEAASMAAERIVDFCAVAGASDRQSMCLSLALEEMLVLINEHALDRRQEKFTDVRVTVTSRQLTLRLRYAGAPFNPLRYAGTAAAGLPPEEDETIGVRMIRQMAAAVEYRQVFGMNNLLIVI